MDEYTNLINDTSIPEKIKQTVLTDIALHQQDNHHEIINILLSNPTHTSLKVLLHLILQRSEYKNILFEKKDILYEISNCKDTKDSDSSESKDITDKDTTYSTLLTKDRVSKDITDKDTTYSTLLTKNRESKDITNILDKDTTYSTLLTKIFKILNNTPVLLPVPIPLYFYGLVSRNEYQYFYSKYNYRGVGSIIIKDKGVSNNNIIKGNINYTDKDINYNYKDKLNINLINKDIRDMRDKDDSNTASDTNNVKKNKSTQYNDISILFKPLQCKICGLRFGEEEENKNIFGLHLEEHSRKNRVMSDKESISREYFPGVVCWCTNVTKLNLKVGGGEENKIRCDGRPPLCCICGCKIELVWDDEEDEWVLRNGVGVVKEGEYYYCHRECVI